MGLECLANQIANHQDRMLCFFVVWRKVVSKHDFVTRCGISSWEKKNNCLLVSTDVYCPKSDQSLLGKCWPQRALWNVVPPRIWWRPTTAGCLLLLGGSEFHSISNPECSEPLPTVAFTIDLTWMSFFATIWLMNRGVILHISRSMMANGISIRSSNRLDVFP